MAERSKKGVLVAAIGWVVIIACLAAAYKFFVRPRSEEKLETETGSESRYKHELTIAADSFSGYCILRSELFRGQLKSEGVRLSVKDDGADYDSRIKAIRDGSVQMAVFTIDSLVTSSVAIGSPGPATIVMVIDETRGADAILAAKDGIKSIRDLDSPDARIVLTPNSPSEFLARTVIAHFSLPRLPDKWRVEADGAREVYRMLSEAGGGERRAYVLWEPYVSRAVQEGARVLLDSSKLSGYIVDVLVAQREFLRGNPDLVGKVVSAYLRAAYSYARKPDGMAELVREDAEATGGEGLDEEQARSLVKGIQWKNTLENYAHFGLLVSGSGEAEVAGARQVQHIEDIIGNIVSVLVKTGALKDDPLSGKASVLFYDKTLAALKRGGFHPGRKLDLIADVGLGAEELGGIRADAELAALSEGQWQALVPVGELSSKPISFARGTARMNIQSQRELAALAGQLKSWPRYYLSVIGHARAEGDPEANMRLALERARAAADFLVSQGVGENRIRAQGAKPSGEGGAAQSVSFVLGQIPY